MGMCEKRSEGGAGDDGSSRERASAGERVADADDAEAQQDASTLKCIPCVGRKHVGATFFVSANRMPFSNPITRIY